MVNIHNLAQSGAMERSLKRISLMVREDHYKKLSEDGINISGLIRDLVADHLSEHKITISVTQQTYDLYSQIVANTGSTDEDIEKYFRDALHFILQDKIKAMQELESKVFKSEDV